MRRLIQLAAKDGAFVQDVMRDHRTLDAGTCRKALKPTVLRDYNQLIVQETLANYRDYNGTFACALNSCRVISATAGMVARRRKWLLGGPPGRPQTWFAFSFVDVSSRHIIPLGLDLAAFGAQCLFCGDAGQLRPYSAIGLLITLSENQKVTPAQIA